MSDSLSQHCPNCKAQTIEIGYWQLQARSARKELKSEQKRADNAMDNYDAVQRRCEVQAAEIERLREVVDSMIVGMADIKALVTPAQFVIDRGETK
jgi:hypothetical protein